MITALVAVSLAVVGGANNWGGDGDNRGGLTTGPTEPNVPGEPGDGLVETQPLGTTIFQLASVNLLGADHTDGPGGRPGFEDSDVRLGYTRQVLDQRGVDVVGFQEMHKKQAVRWTNNASTEWGLFPGMTMSEAAAHNSIAWRLGSFELVEAHTIKIPYFRGNELPMPYVLLRHIPSGQLSWFINVHNPANTRGPAQKWRDLATRREMRLVNSLRASYPGVPVFLTGDMNDREKFFCPIASGSELVSANGGYAAANVCEPPAAMKVDWVLGTPGTTFTSYVALRDALVRKASDHPYIIANANIPTPERQASPIRRVVVLSIEGLRPGAIRKLGPAGLPRLHRFMDNGASTLNARTSVESTTTLPNIFTTLTGRRVAADTLGHGVTYDADRGETVHARSGRYVSSVFDLVHNAGRRTALFTSTKRAAMAQRSWSGAHGGPDLNGRDNGRNKVSAYVQATSDVRLVRKLRDSLTRRPAVFSYVVLSGLEQTGLDHGFSSKAYYDALRLADRLLGRVMNTVNTKPKLVGRTMVIVTSGSGGSTRGNADPTLSGNYTVPLLVWGPGVVQGAELYDLNPAWSRPGDQPAWYSSTPPIINGVTSNLALAALRLPPIPGSEHDSRQTFNVWTDE